MTAGSGLVRVGLHAAVSAVVDLSKVDSSGRLDPDACVVEVRVHPLGASYVASMGGVSDDDVDRCREALNGSWYFEPLAHLPEGVQWES